MSVRLIAITKPVIAECADAGELLSYCARVSNPANQANVEGASKLMAYLVAHQHWSPFEMASMTVEIKTTRDIARQILRHRSFSFQEFSQRYAAVSAPPVLREARLQDVKNRQNSLANVDENLSAWWLSQQTNAATYSTAIYEEALRRGVAKEVARAVLPEGLTESVMYMAGTIRSFIHYCKLRMEKSTQAEHRAIAAQIQAVLLEQIPGLSGVVYE